MQSHLSPTSPHHIAPDEHACHPTSPDYVEQDSPGKKISVLGKFKEKAMDKAKKLKTKFKKNPSTEDHGNEEERSGGTSNSSSDDDQADSNEAQVDSNEPSYQNQILEETKGDHGNIYTKTISGLEGFLTRDKLKGTPAQAQADAEAPAIDSKQELSTDYSQEPRSPGQESAGTFRKSSQPTDSTAVATGGPFVESVNEEERSWKDAPMYEQGDFVPARESDTGYEAGSEKAVTQEFLSPTFDTAKGDFEEDEDKKDAALGIQNEEKPLTDKEEFADSLSSMTGEPTTELDTEAKSPTLTDRAYKGLGAAKGSIAAAAAAAVGALGYGGVSSRGGEQGQELGIRDEGTEGPKDKSYTDLAREKVGGVKDSITGRLQSGKKEGPVGSTEDEPSENPSSEASSTITGTAESFKDSIASKLGYGGAATGGEEATSSPESIEETGEQKPYMQKLYETATRGADVVATKLGYGGERAEEASRESDKAAFDEAKTDEKSYTQKLYETAAGAKGIVTSKLGYGGEERSEGSAEQQSKDEVATVSRFSPGEEEKALSQLITDAVSNSATTVKDTLMSPFSKGSNNVTTPSSSTISTDTARGVEKDDATSPTSEQSIVGRVSGVVSSILGKKSNGEKKDGEQAAMPASPDITPEEAVIQ